ncbi:HD domain-containing protein [Thalassobaculum sp.]|uniref:HD domain-containing protein n=1 Tax=Thalassobaculum sp. TaxID=2022740 RepID=UPI0032ECC908
MLSQPHDDIETEWTARLRDLVAEDPGADSAHDIHHLDRVWANARTIMAAPEHRDRVDTLVVLAAAYLHDCVAVPKSSPDRPRASRMAAERASGLLHSIGFPESKIPAVAHAIAAHSYSARIPTETLEAKILQDADRLDAVGAIGLARTIAVGAELGRPLFHPTDPAARSRPVDEVTWSADHLMEKIVKLPATMNTAAGRALGERRIAIVHAFLAGLEEETGASGLPQP